MVETTSFTLIELMQSTCIITQLHHEVSKASRNQETLTEKKMDGDDIHDADASFEVGDLYFEVSESFSDCQTATKSQEAKTSEEGDSGLTIEAAFNCSATQGT